MAPLDRVKILLQVQSLNASTPKSERYRGLVDGLQGITQRCGWRALYRGNSAQVLRILPDTLIKFMVNDTLKVMFAPPDGRPIGLTGKLAAGTATGMLKCVMVYPLDLARTRMAADVSRPGHPLAYEGLAHCLQSTLQHEGWRGLYRGLLASMMGVGPYLGISFTMYDELQQLIPDDRASRNSPWYALAKMGTGITAGLTAHTVVYPLDTLRRRMQVSGAPSQRPAHTGYGQCARQLWKEAGPLAFYRGFAVSCLKTVPAASIQFLLFDAIRYGLLVLDPTTGSPA